MAQITTIGLDIAKHVFQAHGADPTGQVVFRKRALLAGSSSAFSRHSRPASSRWKPVPVRTTGHERSANWVIPLD